MVKLKELSVILFVLYQNPCCSVGPLIHFLLMLVSLGVKGAAAYFALFFLACCSLSGRSGLGIK
jgi:hypothetical protein